MKPINTKLRSLNTKFWDDGYIIELSPIEKLLFLYLLTSPLTNLAGVYEVSMRRISFDTGIESNTVKTILEKFFTDGKMLYQDGFIIIINHLKNQSLNDNMKINIETTITNLPDNIKKTYLSIVNPLKGFETLWRSESEVGVEVEVENKVKVNPEPENSTSHSVIPSFTYKDIKPKSFENEDDLRNSIENILEHYQIKSDKSGITTLYTLISVPENPLSSETALKLFFEFCSNYEKKATEKQKLDGMKYVIGIFKKKINDKAIKLREQKAAISKKQESKPIIINESNAKIIEELESKEWSGFAKRFDEEIAN